MLGTGQRVGLDNIVYRLVRHAPNGVSSLELARRMGMEHEELLRASDPADKKRKFDVEKLELLMHHSGGGSVVAEYLAEIAGGNYEFLTQPQEKYLAIGREPLGAQTLFLLAQAKSGEIAKTIAAATERGNITSEDLAAISAASRESIELLMAIVRTLDPEEAASPAE